MLLRGWTNNYVKITLCQKHGISLSAPVQKVLKGTISQRDKCQIVTISAGLIYETNTPPEEAPEPQNENKYLNHLKPEQCSFLPLKTLQTQSNK